MAVVIVPDAKLLSVLNGCLANDRSSQKEFYAAYFGFGHNVCKRYLWDDNDTLDATHDGFLKIYVALKAFECPGSQIERSLKPWLRIIFARTSIDHLRSKAKMRWLELPEVEDQELPAASHTAQIESHLSHKEILEMISRLSPVYRAVFNLHVIDGFTHPEIAAMLQISEGASRSNLAKARKNLQQWLNAEQLQNVQYGRTAV